METIAILLIALALDLAFGEPPNAWHPVAWLGKLISLETRALSPKRKPLQLACGTGAVVVTIGLIVTATCFSLAYLRQTNAVAYVIIASVLLKFCFSLRGLKRAAEEVRRLIAADHLAQARTSVKSLVSRDTAGLDRSQLISATVESTAENSCDSFVAPLFYFILFGVPGAVAYRIVNTFDAMIGYHGQWEYSGKFAARLDDIANYVPARIAAVMTVLAAWITGRNFPRAWHTMLRDHDKAESPNAGWTMSAMAGALEVQLEKVGHYKLGDSRYSLSLDTVDSALYMTTVAAIIWSLLAFAVEVIHFVTA